MATCALVLALVLAVALAFATTLRWPGAGLFRLILIVGASTPAFLLGVAAILLFYQHLGWLPATGRTDLADGPAGPTGFLTVDGLLGGKPTSLSFGQVAPNRRVSLAYSFRYFQDYDEPIQLPQGFEPTRVGVEIRNAKDPDASHSFRQAFVWKAQGMSVETEASGKPSAKGDADVQTETE